MSHTIRRAVPLSSRRTISRAAEFLPRRALCRSIVLSALITVFVGCSVIPLEGGGAADGVEGPAEYTLDQLRLERLFEDQVEKITGGPGYLRSQVDGIDILMVSDPSTDRMRLIVPVPLTVQVGVEHLIGMLEANFHAGLDARYAISEGVIYGVFAHRMSTLGEEDFIAGYRQALSLARRFGEVTSDFDPTPEDASSR